MRICYYDEGLDKPVPSADSPEPSMLAQNVIKSPFEPAR